MGTVPMYRTHRTHHTYPVSDRSSNRFFIFLNKNRLLDRSLTGYVWWVRWVRYMGTVHGYDRYGGTVDEYRTWARWRGTWARFMGTVHRYGARTQTYAQHLYPHPTTVPKTNSRNRTQQYSTPVPVPNTRAQHPYPTPVPVPNTRTEHPYPYPYLKK